MSFRLFYRILLLAYPRTFRQDHGDEASRLFDEACRESWRARGVTGVLTRLCRALIEVPVRGYTERASARGGARRTTLFLTDLLQDARYGIRSLRRSPAFTLTALVTMTIGITLNTAMKITMQAMSMNQCSQACSTAIRVAAACRFSWRTPGPPGRSFTAQAAPLKVPARSISEASLLEMLFIVLTVP